MYIGTYPFLVDDETAVSNPPVPEELGDYLDL